MNLALILSLTLQTAQTPPTPLETLNAEAAALRPQIRTTLAKSFLDQVPNLRDPGPRSIYQDQRDKTRWISPRAFAQLSEAEKKNFGEAKLKPGFYFTTRWGSPLSYTRLVEVLGKHGVSSFNNKKILDFGYGQTGHLLLMAKNGADAVGVDIDSILKALYSEPMDTGKIGSGSVKIVEGFWPSDAKTKKEVGGNYDLIISKNTLKKGYIHPASWVPKNQLVDLGMDDATFLRTVHNSLKPHGKFLIYNICPAQNPKKYIPWAEGQSPFDKRLFEETGFKVLAIDVDDTAPVREMAKALGWDKSGMDLENDLRVWYTLVEKA